MNILLNMFINILLEAVNEKREIWNGIVFTLLKIKTSRAETLSSYYMGSARHIKILEEATFC